MDLRVFIDEFDDSKSMESIEDVWKQKVDSCESVFILRESLNNLIGLVCPNVVLQRDLSNYIDLMIDIARDIETNKFINVVFEENIW